MLISYYKRTKLLSLYYVTNSFCWLALLVRLGILLPLVGKKFLPGGIADYFLTLQAVSLGVDFFLRILGLTNLNLKFFLLNCASKFFVSYQIIYENPQVARSEFFSLLIVAWGTEELIKYIYLGYKLKFANGLRVPGSLRFLYLSNFIVLFPFRCVCELCLSFIALKYIQEERLKNLVRVIVVLYVPVFYLMYKKMLKRRTTKLSSAYDHVKKD